MFLARVEIFYRNITLRENILTKFNVILKKTTCCQHRSIKIKKNK